MKDTMGGMNGGNITRGQNPTITPREETREEEEGKREGRGRERINRKRIGRI